MAAAGVGVPQLETLLSPIPEHSTILFLNDPGVEAETFLYQAAYKHLEAGRKVVYAVTNRSPSTVVKAMRDFGFDPSAHADRMEWIDTFSPLMGMASEARYLANTPGNVEEFAMLVEKAARAHPDALLVVDSLSQLIDQAGSEPFSAVFPRLLQAMKRFEMATVLFTKWPYDVDITNLTAAFDGVVSLRGVEERVMLSQYFCLDRATWKGDVDAKPRLYKSLKPGGVHVYIPKVVVTGPYNAGKSSFVQALSDAAVSADQLGTTVALDHGRATMDGLTADVFGTPGQSRFDPILKIVAGQALGVIVVVDATKPESFDRAREMLELTWRKGLPGIIAANKQDLPDAIPPDEVAKRIAPPPGVRVVGCIGQERDSARNVLKQLIDQILTMGASP